MHHYTLDDSVQARARLATWCWKREDVTLMQERPYGNLTRKLDEVDLTGTKWRRPLLTLDREICR